MPLTFVHFCYDNIILWKQESYFDIDFIVGSAFSSNLELWFFKNLVTESGRPLSRILKLTGCKQDVRQLQNNLLRTFLLFSLRNFMVIFSHFSFQTTIKTQKRKTAIAIATNIFTMVYKNHIFEHIHMVHNGIIVSKVAGQWPLTLASLQVKASKLFPEVG